MIDIANRVAIGDILRRNAARFPNKTALTESNKELTFQELNALSNQFANYLINSGLEKGDKVVTICENSWEFVVIFSGLAKAGLVWVPVNPGIGLNEKLYILEMVEAKMVIGQEALVNPNKAEILDKCSNIMTITRESDKHSTFLELTAGQSKEEPMVDIEDRDLAQIMFTSGTTGKPKGVMISHLAVYIASLNNIIEIDMQEDDNVLAMMPMFHCAQHTVLMAAVHRAAKTVIVNGFEPEQLMQEIHGNKISIMFALPMMYRALLSHPNRTDYHLDSLRKCMYVMAPMDKPTLESCIAEFKADFLLATGQTEIYPATMVFRPEEQLRRFGSYWGTSAIINDTAIMDDDGNILEKGEVGEIVHRGPNVMIGYYKNEEESMMSRKFGWHHTGDMGYWDEDGQMVFVDRKKDIIKTGGENVSSMQVEGVLLSHQDILNVAVVGIPHEYWAEAVTAFVVLKPDAGKVIEADIIQYCKEELGSFQAPKSVVFMQELPMTTTGKIQKHQLRTEYKEIYRETENQ